MKLNLSIALAVISVVFIASYSPFTSKQTIVLQDIEWDSSSPATMHELTIPLGNSLAQGLIYTANGKGKHPTLLLLHGYPGNERNLDIAQVVRANGWNVIYFNYRGSWGSHGQFSLMNCVEDVITVVGYCKKYSDSLQIDTSNIALFGHSMGAWVCLKSLERLPSVKKGFALSTWNIYEEFKNVTDTQQLLSTARRNAGEYFVLNTPLEKIFEPVFNNVNRFRLAANMSKLSDKMICMLDEHSGNKNLADTLKRYNSKNFKYDVWKTDHSFSNKRVSVMQHLLNLLNK
ncbi:MAG: hypothetical protein DI539_24910 [Flavobacterium psychrophilum]|nr:MAG: hypothetical protein DI539_24910 [Flavobacterium psychrophilum]